MKKLKVLFHINEIDKWKTVLANTNNLIKDTGIDNVDIDIVANGAAVLLFNPDASAQRSNELNEISKLSELGVKITLCRNSLNGLNMDETALPEYIEVVQAAVTRLAAYQLEGYAYIKP